MTCEIKLFASIYCCISLEAEKMFYNPHGRAVPHLIPRACVLVGQRQMTAGCPCSKVWLRLAGEGIQWHKTLSYSVNDI